MKRKDGKRNNPGQGRKPNIETIFQRTIRTYAERFPEITDELLAKALPQSISFKCKHCKKLNTIKRVPGTGDKEVLIHIDNRVQGKATTRVELNERNRTLDNTTKAKWFIDVRTYETEMELTTIEAVEAEVLSLSAPNEAKAMSQNGQFATCNDGIEAAEAAEADQGSIVEIESVGGQGGDPDRKYDVLLVGSPSAETKIPNVESEVAGAVEAIIPAKNGGESEAREDNSEGEEDRQPEHWTSVEPEEPTFASIEEIEAKLQVRNREMENEAVEVSNFG